MRGDKRTIKDISKSIFFLIILILLTQQAYAITANSSNYSTRMFGTGMATATPSSTNYDTKSLLEGKSTTRNAESLTYQANIGFFGNNSYHRTVIINSYSVSPSSAVVGSTIGLSISAINYQALWVVITAPNSQEQTVDLINGQTVNYLPSPSIVGRYNVTFYANSSTGAITSVISYFELTEATTTTTPSGGGGTTTIIEECAYIWDCSPWSICLEGIQTRKCENTGTCTGIEEKPLEQRICSDSLFDVMLEFTDLVITENDTLEFNVSLIEQEGIEKIDVQLRYSIMDEDDNEIFSQIETRAVEGELNFRKEISEVKLTKGEYILRVDILYGNLQRAFAEQRFEVKKGELEILEREDFSNKLVVILGILIFILLLIIFFLMRKRKKSRKGGHKEYRRKIKKNLMRIKSKTLLIIAFSLITVGLLFIGRNSITGFVTGNIYLVGGGLKILGLMLILGIFGVLIFLSRRKIKAGLEKVGRKVKRKHPKESIKGLMKKKVYVMEGVYIGRIKEVILKSNKIDSLKIKLSKTKKKGIIIKYGNIRGVGDIVIADEGILEKLDKS
jgi:sporulation protein YlmC with PRC-barrel domain